MRYTAFVLLSAIFFVPSLAAGAQDATALAVQQSQLAVQQSQLASQQAAQANQQAASDAQNTVYYGAARKPAFSVHPGTYQAPVTVRLTAHSRGAAMFYTTDDWTPTALSTPYTGPITVDSTTTLQAISIAPGQLRSAVATGVYTINSSHPATPASAAVDVPALTPGTPIRIAFLKPVDSKGMQIGDKLPVGLAQDLLVGGVLVARKDTPVSATVTLVDRPGIAGAPATISFAIRSIDIDGKTIPLLGTETLEGRSRRGKAQSIVAIPGIGVLGLLMRGKDAGIPQGALLTATIAGGSNLAGTR